MRIILLLALLILGPSTSEAQSNDVDLGPDSTGTNYWLIAGSVKQHEKYKFAWFRADASKDATVSYRTSKFRIKFDCINERLGQTARVDYAPNGSVMNKFDTDYPQMTVAVPGSVGASWLNHVCAAYGKK